MKIKSTKIYATTLIVLSMICLFSASCNQNKTIQIKAALVYKMGAAQPVARTKFYLLNKDLKALDEDKNTKSVYNEPSVVKFLLEKDVRPNGLPPTVGIQEDNIKEFIVATTTTDFEGNAKFDNVPSGTYYIGGFTTTRSDTGYVVWSVKVDSNNAKETLLLDQNNAFKVEDY